MSVTNTVEPILLACVGVILGLSYINAKKDWPAFALLSRWVRWFAISFCAALVIYHHQEGRNPFNLLWITMFLGWFLLETIYNWWAVNMLSKSSIPLFPRFKACPVLQAWPAHEYWLNFKDKIQAQGFKPLVGAKSMLFEGMNLNTLIFESMDKSCRAQIIFLPQKTKGYLVVFSIGSLTATGLRYITDNMRMPYGGFYPEHWRLVRKPLVHAFDTLLKVHKNRLKVDGQIVIPWQAQPLEDLNEQQKLLESLNAQLGFLRPQSTDNTQGRLSSEGLYRLWKAWWLMNYFGISQKI